MNSASLWFVLTLALCSLAFLGLDLLVMKLNGLTLFFHP
jgi:hypothetical protein|tara:strand:+ start:1128 stop:1244 length:117 start_codon:yes stop_codon:yes gene_type:complete